MQLRETFDTAAELYDRIRPGYPPQLYDDLLAIAGLERGARLLEIGPGTGQATLPLADRGFVITAVELGPGLASVARRNLAAFPSVRIEVADFEAWTSPAEPFDMVYSATAFHWLDHDTRLDRCADVLRPGGWLAVWENGHVAGGDAQFWVDVQDCYERWDPATPPGLTLPEPTTVPDMALGFEHSSRFGQVATRRYFWTRRYTRDQYLDVLRTYSGHIALPEPNKSELFACIGSLIDTRYGGAVTKGYLTRLTVAQRLP